MSNQDGRRKDDSKLQMTNSGLLGEFRGEGNISSMLAAVSAQNWRKVSVSGDHELMQAFWLEATVAGLQVRGYSPSLAERELAERRLNERRKTVTEPEVRMSANSIAKDLRERVIPELKRQANGISKKRQLNRSSEGKSPDGNRKDKFFEAQALSYRQAIFRLERSQSEMESLGSKTVKAQKVLDHGVTRYEVTETQSLRIDRRAKDIERSR